MTRYTIFQLALMVAATALLFYFEHRVAAAIVCLLTLIVATLALAAPSLLHTFQAMGKRAGAWVGSGIGICLLTIVYYAIFAPVGVLLRIARVDLLDRRFPVQGKTKWIDRVDYGEDKRLYGKSYTRPHAASASTKAAK